MMPGEAHPSAAYTPRPTTGLSVAKIQSNILARRASLSVSAARRGAEGRFAASLESKGLRHIVRGEQTQRDFNRELDGTMSLSWDTVNEWPDQGTAGKRSYVALVTPGLLDCTFSGAPALDVHFAFARVVEEHGRCAVTYIEATADGVLTPEERSRLDAHLARIERWVAETRAAVRRG